ncbi:MAG: hypothetical protein ACKOBR_11425 [Actinomycetota bacterium]
MNSNRNGMLVSSSEAERFTLHQTLRGLMPEAVADTLMSHLPPAGWSDVARKSDIEDLGASTGQVVDTLRVEMVAGFDRVNSQITALDKRVDNLELRFGGLETRFQHLELRFDRVEERLAGQIRALDAKLESRTNDLEAKFDNRIDNLETKLNTRIDNLETRINELDSKFGNRINELDSKFDNRINILETKFDARFDELASMKRYVISTGVALAAVMCGVGAPLWFSLL